ncbi:MAG: T9SS type B sorting domain-containing protein [Dokdonia sp.]
MNRLTFQLILYCLMTSAVLAQKEAAVWYFGEQAGLSFVDGRPIPLLDGQIDSLEGCASIATSDGDLLFYTNGETIWNRNHEIMVNGEDIGGNLSATQAALIIPKPGSGSIYYVFTTDAVQFYQGGGNGAGFNYTTVDMSNGVGVVVEKNKSLLSQSTEKVTAVLAANGIDIWVVTQKDALFYSYLISASGVNETPVTSAVSFGVSDFNNIRGSLKASPDGLHIANAFTIFEPQFTGRLYLYDFDNATGLVSGEQLIGDNFGFYGIEFSSDSSKLYASGKLINNESGSTLAIYQYNMDAADISSSSFLLAELRTTFLSDISGTLQLAMDKKIYYTFPGTALSVIEKPNELRDAARFKREIIDLGGRKSNFGLPPFVPSFFESIFDFENICYGDQTQFAIYPDAPVASVIWNFDDPDSDTANTSTSFNPTHIFTAPGPYVVSVDVTFTNGRPNKRFIEVVDIRETPTLTQSLSLVQCDVDGQDDGITSFNLTAIEEVFEDSEETYEFHYFTSELDAINSENNIDPIGYINTAPLEQVYLRVFSDPSCFEIFPMTLNTQTASDVGIIDLTVCELDESSANQISLDGVEALLTPLYPGVDLSFYSSKEDALLELRPFTIDIVTLIDLEVPELFFRGEIANDCAIVGGILFDLKGEVGIEDQQVYLCSDNTPTVLNAGATFSTYLWSTGATTSSIQVEEPGVYEVTVSNGPGCIDTAVFTVVDTPEISFEVRIEDFQQSNTLRIFALSEISPLKYSIDGGQTFQNSPSFTDVAPGIHTVVVSDQSGCAFVTQQITVRGTPRYFTPNGDGVNDFWQVDRARDYQQFTVTIFDRFGKLLARFDNRSRGWDGTTAGEAMPTGSYWFNIELGDNRYTGHFALIRR